MKKILVFTIAVCVCGAPVAAAENFRHNEPGRFYFGGKLQHLDLQLPDDTAQSIGGLLGAHFWAGDKGYVSVDTYFSRTLNADSVGTANQNVNLTGIYLAYKSPDTLYGKAKIGGVSTELDNENLSDDEGVHLSWGVGVGMEVLFGTYLELEYETVRDDVDAWSLSLILSD